MATVLMLASFGLEIVECAGALVRAREAGDRVHAAVLLSRQESRPQIVEAAARLGVEDVEFLGFDYGDVGTGPTAKMPLVELIRRVKPDIAIFQDPEHAQTTLTRIDGSSPSCTRRPSRSRAATGASRSAAAIRRIPCRPSTT